MAEKIAIIGSSGFVGRYLIDELTREGKSVVGLGSAQLDLLHAEAPQRLRAAIGASKIVVFISALTPDKGRDYTTLRRNLQMLDPLLTLIREQPPEFLSYISSDAVYSESEQSLVRESTPAAPNSFHGVMHLAREIALRDACGTKLPLQILRLPPLFGLGDPHNSYGPNRFARTLLSDGVIKLFGQGEEKRDHLFVEDAARMITGLLAVRATGVVNVMSGRSVSFAEIAKTLIEQAQTPGRIENAPRQSPVTHRHYDITQLIKLLPDVSTTPTATALRRLIIADAPRR